ncbi:MULTISPECIES: hypothetical protein [Pseudomonas]|jgi:hypothetical protein|uniref:hypothetical protein n=1 Tax=Pseudomonas TaxID=286 RepID=UPI002117421D|nr:MULTISPECIES: hypothetical protein [Pseudomonas]WLG64279.1 hypothetical protein PSH90_09275 [Pseudomonas sp. FP1762]
MASDKMSQARKKLAIRIAVNDARSQVVIGKLRAIGATAVIYLRLRRIHQPVHGAHRSGLIWKPTSAGPLR